jgi:hypothetical protein
MTVGIRKTLWIFLAVLGLFGASEAVAQSPTSLELWVTNQHGEAPTSPPDSVLVYAVGQQADGRPLLTLGKILSGTATRLHLPSGILVTPDKVFVSNEPLTSDPACKSLPGGLALSEPTSPLPICGSITVYDRSAVEAACSVGSALTSVGFTNVVPSKVIEGNQTALFYPFGIAVNTAADELYVANQTRDADSGSVNVYRLSTILASNGTLNLKPLLVIREKLNGPSHIVFDAPHNELFVSNTYSGSVTVYRRNAGGDFTFVREIRDKGAGTNPLQFVSGLVRIDEAPVPDVRIEELFVAHGLPPFNGLISIYDRTANGTPDPRGQIVGIQAASDDLKSLDEPTGLAFDPQRKWLFVGNNPRTTTPGFLTIFDSAARGEAPYLLKQRDGQAGPLFSPVGLALATAASPVATGGDYTLTNSGNVAVPRGTPTTPSRVDVRLTVTLTRPGTVTFTGVTGLPSGVTALPISPATCTASCERTLTLLVSSSADQATSPITVRTSGVFDEQTQCERSTTFTLTVREQIPGLLNVLKASNADPVPGTCTVTSDKADINGQRINCGTVCSGTFRPADSPVSLTAVADTLTSIFSGWSYPGCSSLTQPCAVQIVEGATQNVTAFCDRLVHLTVRTDGSGTGTVDRDRQPLTGVACGGDCYVVNTVVRLTARPTGNSRFVRWTGCAPADAPTCEVTLRDSTTVTATFDGQATLRVEKSELGGQGTVTSIERGNDGQPISCGSACEKTFDVGTTVTLQRTITGTSIFAGWAPLRPTPPECAGFDSSTKATLDRQGRTSCGVVVNANPTNVIASFVGTPRQAFIARLYLNVVHIAPPSLDNVDSLVSSLVDVPLLSVQALIDAFFDGPNRPVFAPRDYVKVVARALLWREPSPAELDAGVQFFTQNGYSAATQRAVRDFVIGGSEFKELIAALFPTATP